ncbi:MAG: hypothetical protein AB8F74_12085 [Saprospiraceae bacterium]
MKNRQSVIQHIRFGISQLSAQNGSLQFEHICRHLTRARICSNILPATGPVQAGGDQGRDFETFHTYLKNSHLKNDSFIGLQSDRPIVFACSLEKEPAKKNGKIEKDVATILEKGTPVDRIYFFSGEDIPVAYRHKVIDRVKVENSVDLEVLDANSISEFLADSDLFWIANQYLSISSEIYPRPSETSNWYEKLFNQYKEQEDFDLTYEAFQDVKSALRHIYKDKLLKQDLPFWIGKMRTFVTERERTMPRLTQNGIYEIFVASLIGQDSIENQEEHIREYFSKLDAVKSKDEFSDATCLISFVGACRYAHSTTFTDEEINEWSQKIVALTDSKIETTTDVNLLSKLHELKFLQYLNGIRIGFDKKENFNKSLELALKDLEILISLIPQAPFFPLENLSHNVNHYIKLMSKNGVVSEGLEELASQIDDLYGTRVGEITAAESLRDRALTYLNNKNEVMAIKILHKAKLKWMKDETRLPLVLTLLLLSECYKKINMTFAAKYFALGAAHFSIRDDNFELASHFIKSLNQLANIEYAHGAWLNYLDLLDLLLPAGQAIKKDFDLYENEEGQSLLFHSTVIKYMAKRFAPSLSVLVDTKIKGWSWIGEEIEEVYILAKKHYDIHSDEVTWREIEKQLKFKPFNDIGATRKLSFEAYGIGWTFHFKNDYQTNATAEQAIATLQIILAELANTDLHLIKSNVSVEIKVVDDKPNFIRKPSNNLSSWELDLPASGAYDTEVGLREIISNYHAFVFTIIREISLLKNEEFDSLIEKSIVKSDLINLTFFGKLYEDFFKDFLPKEKFEEARRECFNTPFEIKKFKPQNHPLLKWRSEISPKFSEFEIKRDIDARYAKALIPLEITFKTLLQNDQFKEKVKVLRAEGWLDWQILNAVASSVVSYKLNRIYGRAVHTLNPRVFFDLMQTPESQSYVEIPISLFSDKNFKINMDIMLGSVLAAYKLQSRSNTPNFLAIREFLNKRFKFNELDMPEKSPFKF